MSGGKQTPRQKMIGMMYLVLTALLALNISKEIINAFITIDSGLKSTNANFDTKNAMTYKAFEKAKMNDEKKAGPVYAKAMQAQALSLRVCNYITSLRGQMVALSGGFDPKSKIGDTLRLTLLEKPDDYDNPTHFMVGSDPANVTGQAKPLKDSLIKYYYDLTKLLPDQKIQKAFFSRIKPSIPLRGDSVWSAEHGEFISWEWYNFYHAPIVAAIAQLDRMINDVKNAEGDAVNELFASINANDFKFDVLTAKVVAPTSYVFTGDHYTSDIFVAAFNSTQNPVVYLCNYDSVTKKPIGPIDSTTVKVLGGLGKYDMVAGSPGVQTYSGLIRIKKPDGNWDQYPFKQEYMVAAPSAAVFLEKMNVFYIGVDNPISISAAGVAPSALSPGLSGGTMTSNGKPGSYIVRVSGGTEATLNVSAKMNGASKSMGSFKFRIKRVPDPVAYVGSLKADGQMSKAELNGQSGVFAKMENFDFDLKFTVVSFVMSMNINGVFVDKKANGPAITSEMHTMLASVKPGNKVFFEQVTVQGPDGTLRKIPGVNIKVK